MQYRQATKADLTEIEELLKDNNLPFSDCSEHIDNFILKEEKNKIIGIGCIEIYGRNGLIRSMVVAKNYRRSGVAKEILRTLKEKAFDSGVTDIYLLTETAIEYFKTVGFKALDRDDAPDSIKNTKQFNAICPSSAVVMYSKIKH